jgi:hypothetical protein
LVQVNHDYIGELIKSYCKIQVLGVRGWGYGIEQLNVYLSIYFCKALLEKLEKSYFGLNLVVYWLPK